MTLGTLTEKLQALCHEGMTVENVYIRRLDGIYKIGDIKTYTQPDGKPFCVIEAKEIDDESYND